MDYKVMFGLTVTILFVGTLLGFGLVWLMDVAPFRPREQTMAIGIIIFIVMLLIMVRPRRPDKPYGKNI